MEVLQRELGKAESDQALLRLLRQLPEARVVFLVAHQMLQVCVRKRPEETVAVGSGATQRRVFGAQVQHLGTVDTIVGVLIAQRVDWLQFADQRYRVADLCHTKTKI